MIKFSSHLLTLAVAGFYGISEGHENGFKVDESMIYSSRYPAQVCPPEYPKNRTRMEHHLTTQAALQLQQEYGKKAAYWMRNVEVLRDTEDEEACRHFNKIYDKFINNQIQLFKRAEPEYFFDFTYYKSEGLYYIVIDGGQVKQEDPDNPGDYDSRFWKVEWPTMVHVYETQTYKRVPPP